MKHRVCPWWLGYFLASPIRRWRQNPAQIVAPYVHEGMTVLEPGPGMGFFTLELARCVGRGGRVIAVDVQQKMLDGLKRRAQKAGVLERIDFRLASESSLNISDLIGTVDFTLAFAMVHEVSSASALFAEAARVSKPQATLLLAEPAGHVSEAEFREELRVAEQSGFVVAEEVSIRRSQAVLLRKT